MDVNSKNNHEDEVDLRSFILNLLSNYKFFLVVLILTSSVGFFMIRYSTPKYKVHAKVLVQDDKKNGTPSSAIGGTTLKDFGELFGVKNNVANEVEIIGAKSLLMKIVKQNDYFIRYFKTGMFDNIELYDKSPFKVNFISIKDTISPVSFSFNLNGDSEQFAIQSKDMPSPLSCKFGDTIKRDFGSFYITKTGFSFEKFSYMFDLRNIDQSVSEIASNLNVEVTNKETTVIGLDYVTTIPKKGEEILRNLISAYIDRNLSEKNRIIDSTLIFLTQRIEIVVNDLNNIEADLQGFKERNKIVDIPSQAQALVTKLDDFNSKTKDIQIKLDVVSDMLSAIKRDNKKMIPNLSSNNPSFLYLLQNYNSLVIQRDNILLTSKEGSPLLSNIDLQLNTIKSEMIKNLQSQQQELLIAKSQFENENQKINQTISLLPSIDRSYINFSRERDVKQALYLFLLQQKEQAAISKASNISNAAIIDGPKSEYSPFSPKRLMIYMICFLFALIITIFWIILKNILNNKIVSKEDIINATECSIITEIGHSLTPGIVVDYDGRSVISEQFRQLRTNLTFVLGQKKCSTILITSSISGEGKSFVSYNLAQIYARSEKRVLLIEMDLRKPKLSNLLNINNDKGFTNYVVNKDEISNYIIELPHLKNLYFLSSGPLPPNPAELLMSSVTDNMFKELESKYDYIIIDTPPLGLVTDSQIISRHSDVNLYISRINFSFKRSLDIVNDLLINKKLSNLYMVLNDVKEKSFGYGYYGYGYGYGYSSDAEVKKGNFFKNILRFWKSKK